MEKPSHEIILPFYEVGRDMLLPTQPEGRRRNEKDAEHSWSVGILACALAQHVDPTLDVGLVSQFASIHDLVEVYADDTSVWAADEALDFKESKEADALQKIKDRFSHFPWLVTTIEAYERQDTNEALFVRAIDKYIALCIRFMDGGEFFRSNGITKEIFDKNLEAHRKKAHGHTGVAEYYEKIRSIYDQHSEHFYAT
jgi:5'-deoxynucleotidase YfbR-like HD superfamily hydrolase